MEKIYKYELKITDNQKIAIPVNPRILSVQQQNGKLILYEAVVVENELRDYEFLIIGTGNAIPKEVNIRGFSYDSPSGFTTQYLGTIIDYGLVWHVFFK